MGILRAVVPLFLAASVFSQTLPSACTDEYSAHYAEGCTTDFAFPDCVNGYLSNYTVCDITADPQERAASLISLLTFDEKINLTIMYSSAVDRIGLPAYEWWQEALHGLAFTFPQGPFLANGTFSYATSFPQPILMSAAFDDALIKDVATVIGTESRAYSNALLSGIDFWTPNINPFKDPRWGRGQETPGEDPFHLQSYVRNLLDGLQGGVNPKYKRVMATCKHWVGYDLEDWEGNERYAFDAIISAQDLSEYYTPSFQACARDAKVAGFMCSYNAVNGVPTCASSYVLQTLLRDHWGWTDEQQWVTSDCDAVENIYDPHNYTSTPEEAVADALIAGTDIDCGGWYQKYLPSAFEQGLFNESVLDRALIRQYSGLIRTGYFDPADIQPYRQLGWSDVNTPEAQALALKAAQEGIVLLKNDGLLPLSIGNGTVVALQGIWSNATTVMQGNYYGIAPYLISPWQAVAASGATVTTDAEDADIIIYAGGIDNDNESEANDRTNITWPSDQISDINSLATLGKPMIVLQMGGGQIDSSFIKNNTEISALLWGGYPGQSGGTALLDVITGKVSPAGRLVTTQYPADYVDQVPMTDMTLRPSDTNPGRTYKWYTGTPVYEFGYGLHYTTFKASFASTQHLYNISSLTKTCNETFVDQCLFTGAPMKISVTNTGSVTSDYSALLFAKGTYGPEPYPNKSLVAYTRLFDIAPMSTSTGDLKITLGALSRADDLGNKIIYPGDYSLVLDTQPLASINFTLVGDPLVLEYWPQEP